MPDPSPTEQPKPEPQPSGMVPSTIHEATGLARVIAMFKTEQLTLLALIAALGYVLFRGPQVVTEVNGNNIIALQEERAKDREANKERDEKYLKGFADQQTQAREYTKERDERFLRAFHEEADKNRKSQEELVKSVLTELPKLTAQIQLLQAAILDLKRKVAPSEVHQAPMPRTKVVILATVIGPQCGSR